MVDTGAIKSYIIINTLRGFSRDAWHAICRKYKWRHTAACWDNTMDQLVPSALLDVHFSAEGEGQDVLNGVFSLNFNKVCMVMDDSRLYSVAHWRCNVWYTGFKTVYTTQVLSLLDSFSITLLLLHCDSITIITLI